MHSLVTASTLMFYIIMNNFKTKHNTASSTPNKTKHNTVHYLPFQNCSTRKAMGEVRSMTSYMGGETTASIVSKVECHTNAKTECQVRVKYYVS